MMLFTTHAERWMLIELRLVPAELVFHWLADKAFRRFVAGKLGGERP